MEVLPQKEPSSGERPEAVGGVAPAMGVVRDGPGVPAIGRQSAAAAGFRPPTPRGLRLPAQFRLRRARGDEAIGTHFGGFATAELSGLIPNARALDHLAASARNSGRAPEQLDPWLP